jgi:ribosome-binding protein aMBF1 (putative translation factor)
MSYNRTKGGIDMNEGLIRNARIKLGFTQKELALRMDVSLSTIKRWENRETFPRFNAASSLSFILDIDVVDLQIERNKKQIKRREKK